MPAHSILHEVTLFHFGSHSDPLGASHSRSAHVTDRGRCCWQDNGRLPWPWLLEEPGKDERPWSVIEGHGAVVVVAGEAVGGVTVGFLARVVAGVVPVAVVV